MSAMKTFLLILGIACVAGFGPPAFAAPVYFTDLAQFNAATANTALVEDFTGQDGLKGSSFTSVGGLTFTRLTGTVNTQQLVVTPAGAGPFGPGSSTGILTDNREDDFRMDFANLTRAVGFDTYLNAVDASGAAAAPEATIEIFGVGGVLIDTFIQTHSAAIVGFFGVIADENIESIRWTTTGGNVVNTGIDNILQGDAIPAPGAITLFAVGLAALGAARRKRTL